MAPADTGDYLLDEDDDDFFAEFNPQPYRGGYDLAATYGSPLPPSANICYPVSSSAPDLPPPPSPTMEPVDPPPQEPSYDGEEAPREPVHESAEVFRDGAGREGKLRRGRWCRRGLWRKCVRVLDYLFGYSDPYAERRIEVDSYVVPVYANRKECGEDALAVEVEVAPTAVGRVEAHDASEELVQSNNDLSLHNNYREEANTYSQPMYNSYCWPSSAQSCSLPCVLDNPDWFPYFSSSEFHHVEESQDKHRMFHQPIHCYHQHCYEQLASVQAVAMESVSSQKLEYYEDFSSYCDQSDICILETPAHQYKIQSYTQISDVPLEPYKPSWSQNLGFYHAYTQGDYLEYDTHSLISDEYGDTGSLFVSPFYPREAEIFEQTHNDEIVSFQQNYHNLSYWNMPMHDVSLITKPAHDFYNINDSLWPFGEHSTYSV
ncbi:uncharacterized protein LOC133912428 isoform X2 [Phragmites australis]|uniref:uncharacterized protein LOC133912428 isoform X2 n=1 Tax=Phragmites australis TaxID=29695 RepID=UPI002D783037|nr:uncharacterized protein LOC133912428 isoform X2 [Phragmites australis]